MAHFTGYRSLHHHLNEFSTMDLENKLVYFIKKNGY